jgi:hypothetical protein
MQTEADVGERESEKDIDGFNNAIESLIIHPIPIDEHH